MSASRIRRSGSGLGPQTGNRIALPITVASVSPDPSAMQTALVRLEGKVPCENSARYDPDLWYSDAQSDIRLAAGICQSECRQLAVCLQGAYERNEPFGVFGGVSARDRRIFAGLEEATEPDDAECDDGTTGTRYELWQHGKTDLEMAAILDVTPNSIQKWRARWVLPPNGIRGRRPADADADLERRGLYQRGYTDKQIAAVLGMRTQAITRWRKRAGFPRHPVSTDKGIGAISA